MDLFDKWANNPSAHAGESPGCILTHAVFPNWLRFLNLNWAKYIRIERILYVWAISCVYNFHFSWCFLSILCLSLLAFTNSEWFSLQRVAMMSLPVCDTTIFTSMVFIQLGHGPSMQISGNSCKKYMISLLFLSDNNESVNSTGYMDSSGFVSYASPISNGRNNCSSLT